MKTSLETVREAVIEAVPELIFPRAQALLGEWRFVLSDKGRKYNVHIPKKCVNKSGRVLGETRDKRYWRIVWDGSSPTTIMSIQKDLVEPTYSDIRPIHLEDCRHILNKRYWPELIEIWEKGSLDDQSEHVIQFLDDHKS